MAAWREIERFKADAPAFRALAVRLLKHSAEALTEWELDFLESVSRNIHAETFAPRQAEKLLEIRDSSEFVTEVHGFNLSTLARQCREARLDLSEHDEEWLGKLVPGERGLRRRDAYRLLRCARDLQLIDMELA